MEGIHATGYAPCYHMDLANEKLTFGTVNYAEMLEKLAEQKPRTAAGKATLSQADISELASKYDPTQMNASTYENFIYDLERKGVLEHSETYDIGLDRVVLQPGHFLIGGVENAQSSRWTSPTLRDAGGNALSFVDALLKNCFGQSDQWKENALNKVYHALQAVKQEREKLTA